MKFLALWLVGLDFQGIGERRSVDDDRGVREWGDRVRDFFEGPSLFWCEKLKRFLFLWFCDPHWKGIDIFFVCTWMGPSIPLSHQRIILLPLTNEEQKYKSKNKIIIISCVCVCAQHTQIFGINWAIFKNFYVVWRTTFGFIKEFEPKINNKKQVFEINSINVH